MLLLEYVWSGTFLSILVCVVIKIILKFFDHVNFLKKYRHIPQLPSHLIIGSLAEYPGKNDAGLAWQRENLKKFPRLSVAWLGQLPLIHVSHPDLVKKILKSSEPKSYSMYKFLHPWLGQGLLTSNGMKWARSRRLLTPAFHSNILKDYLELKNRLCDQLLDNFEESAQTGESLRVFKNMSLFTLDVILQSTMSYETKCQKSGTNHPYIEAIDNINKAIIDRAMKPWYHIDFLYNISLGGIAFKRNCDFVHRVANEIIKIRRKELESGISTVKDRGGNKKHRDFLDTLITARDEDGNGLTDQEIRDEVDTFLFEGHDTTASALSWALYSLAEHQDVQKRCQQEVDELFEDRENDDLLWDDLSKLPYLTMALKESSRLHSPVPEVYRELSSDIDLDGYLIPAGTSVAISTYNIHHNPDVWKDSMKYDPERFSKENIEKRDPFAYVPFSAGPRNCIGQNFAMHEMKTALARILHRYDLSLDPNHKVTKFVGLVMKADDDIKMIVKPRESTR